MKINGNVLNNVQILFKFVKKKLFGKIDKRSLNFKNFQNFLKALKVNFSIVAIKKLLIFKIFLFKTKIYLCLKIFEKKSKINLEKIA